MEIFNETIPSLNKFMDSVEAMGFNVNKEQETNQTEILKEELLNDLLEAELRIAELSSFVFAIREKLAKI